MKFRQHVSFIYFTFLPFCHKLALLKKEIVKIHPRGIFAIPEKVAFWTPDCVTFQWGKGAICIFCRTHCNM